MVFFGKPSLEFWERNCFVCQRQQWQYCIDRKDVTEIDIFSDWGMVEGYGLFCPECFADWGMVEGYGLFCPECFENFIKHAQIKNIEVFWEDGSTTSEECGDVFSKPKPKLKE